MMDDNIENIVLLEINEKDNHFSYTSDIASALSRAEMDIKSLDETIDSIKSLKSNCDYIDYALAASSGSLCGLLDVFLIGKPGESPLGKFKFRK